MSKKIVKGAIGLVIGIVGSILIVKKLGWLPFLGIFLFAWGNNISQDKE